MDLLDPRRLQAWWSHRQGLGSVDTSLDPADVLERYGWARTVGGANPYLTLFSRAGISREVADQSIKQTHIHELPSARGCTYLIPASQFELALKVGQGFSDEAAMNTARKFLGVTDAEIESLMQAVENALTGGQLDPKQLKDSVGGASRNLGDEGKKRGQTTTLPLALGFLQSQGRIRRIPVNGRLDQQRYAYALWRPSPLEGSRMTKEEAYAKLSELYFRWAGPASQAHFQWFSGLGVKASKDAMNQTDLSPIEGTEWYIDAASLDAFQKFKPSDAPSYSLVAGIDSHLLLRRDLQNLILPEDRTKKIAGEKGPLEAGNGLMDLSNNAILDRGRVVGIWEFDPESMQIVYSTFIAESQAMREAIERTEAFARNQLGDVRSFSLDSPASRHPKIEALRQLAGIQ